MRTGAETKREQAGDEGMQARTFVDDDTASATAGYKIPGCFGEVLWGEVSNAM